MAITSGILNQYTPDMCIDSPVNGEILIYDSVSRSFKNKSATEAVLSNIPPASLLWSNPFGPGDLVTISEDLSTFVAIPATELDSDDHANKVVDAVVGNFAGLDENGDLEDSGVSSTDFATASQGLLADSSVQPGSDISVLINDTGYLTSVISEPFTDLVDTPTSYSGESSKVLAVKLDESGLEFIDIVAPTKLSAKGDLLTYDTDEVTLPLGEDGQILKVDTTQPTGIIWADPVAGTDMSLDFGTFVEPNSKFDMGGFI